MHKYRTFETAVLLSLHHYSPDAAGYLDISDILGRAWSQHHLLSTWLSMLQAGTAKPKVTEALANLIGGHQWRFFSPQIMGSSFDQGPFEGPTSYLESLQNMLEQELSSGIESFKSVKDLVQNPSTTTDFLEINLKVVGNFLRTAKDQIVMRDSGIPESVVKFAEEFEVVDKLVREVLGRKDGEDGGEHDGEGLDDDDL